MRKVLLIVSIVFTMFIPLSSSANNTQAGNVVGSHVQCLLPDGNSIFVPQFYCDMNKGTRKY